MQTPTSAGSLWLVNSPVQFILFLLAIRNVGLNSQMTSIWKTNGNLFPVAYVKLARMHRALVKKAHAWYQVPMSRIRAVILVVSLLGNISVALAQAMCTADECCCAGGLCPVHRSLQGRSGTQTGMPCDGMQETACPCSLNHPAKNRPSRISPLALDAILTGLKSPAPPLSAQAANQQLAPQHCSGFIFFCEPPPRFQD